MSENFILQAQLDNNDVHICDDLIDYFKSNDEYKSKGKTTLNTDKISKLSTDLAIQPYSNSPLIKKYLSYLFSLAQIYIKKYSTGFFGLDMLEGFNIQHYAPNEGYFEWHNERSTTKSPERALVWMTYLNDVDDGGETEFKYQNLKIKSQKDFTHTHRGITSPTQHKYIITGWFHHLQVNHVLNHALNNTEGFIKSVKERDGKN